MPQDALLLLLFDSRAAALAPAQPPPAEASQQRSASHGTDQGGPRVFGGGRAAIYGPRSARGPLVASLPVPFPPRRVKAASSKAVGSYVFLALCLIGLFTICRWVKSLSLHVSAYVAAYLACWR